MSLDKAIQHGKEHRKPYRGGKAIDKTCRNHGSCEWCKENREYKNKKREERAKNELEEYEREIDYISPKQVIPVNLNIINIKKHESGIDVENDECNV